MPSFTKRELAIIDALGQNRSAKQIAEKAGAKEETVREQVAELKEKLNASSQEEIPARFADVTGWANRPKDYAAFPPESKD